MRDDERTGCAPLIDLAATQFEAVIRRERHDSVFVADLAS